MTEYAYSRKLVCISEETSMSTMRSVKSSSGGAGVLAIGRGPPQLRRAAPLCRGRPTSPGTEPPYGCSRRFLAFAAAISAASAGKCREPRLEMWLEVGDQGVAGAHDPGVEQAVGEAVDAAPHADPGAEVAQEGGADRPVLVVAENVLQRLAGGHRLLGLGSPPPHCGLDGVPVPLAGLTGGVEQLVGSLLAGLPRCDRGREPLLQLLVGPLDVALDLGGRSIRRRGERRVAAPR